MDFGPNATLFRPNAASKSGVFEQSESLSNISPEKAAVLEKGLTHEVIAENPLLENLDGLPAVEDYDDD